MTTNVAKPKTNHIKRMRKLSPNLIVVLMLFFLSFRCDELLFCTTSVEIDCNTSKLGRIVYSPQITQNSDFNKNSKFKMAA